MPKVSHCLKYNMYIMSIGYGMYYTYTNFNIYIFMIVNICRHILQIFHIDYENRKYKEYKGKLVFDIYKFYNIFLGNMIEVLYMHLAQTITYSSIYYDIALFIPNTFIFEIIFDLFHYITHRISHQQILYKYIHKEHHEDLKNINILDTYKSSLIEKLFTSVLPLVLSTFIFPLSMFQYHVFNNTKLIVELQGHSGINVKGCGHPQCPWLPIFFGIELRNKDHFNHHSKNNCNYSKRFKLWDKVFSTYKT